MLNCKIIITTLLCPRLEIFVVLQAVQTEELIRTGFGVCVFEFIATIGHPYTGPGRTDC